MGTAVTPRPWKEAQALLPPLSQIERESLAGSIEQEGVLQEILVLPDGRIIDGAHRWELSAGHAPSRILDVSEDHALALARRLNIARRHFSFEQIAEERKKDKQRALELRRQGLSQIEVAKLLSLPRTTVEFWEAGAKRNNDGAVNVSPRDLRFIIPRDVRSRVAKRVKKESTAQVAADLHVTVRRVQQIAQQEVVKQRHRRKFRDQEFPRGKYPLIYADPPWKYDFAQSDSRKIDIDNQYPPMELEAICNLSVGELAASDCVLFLWATNPKLPEALTVIRAWGFIYKTNMVWVKDKIGMGYYARQRHELLLIATRGNLPTPNPKHRPDSVIEARRGKHSEKPVEFYEVIERMYPDLPRIELFQRKKRAGWESWGNE